MGNVKYSRVTITSRNFFGTDKTRDRFNQFLQKERITMFYSGLIGHAPDRWHANLKAGEIRRIRQFLKIHHLEGEFGIKAKAHM